MRSKWLKSSTWATLIAALVLVAIIVAAVRAAMEPEPRTEATPPTESEITFDMERNRAYNADDGVVVIPANASELRVENGELRVSESPAAMISNNREAAPSLSIINSQLSTEYTLPEDVLMEDGSIGLLGIPKLSLSVGVFETEDEMEAMSHGVAHFKTTSAWDGNVGLCSHNVNFDLTDGYFKSIHTLENGDSITYQTPLGTRTYAVETVAEIAETDWSYLGRTEDDRVTLVTCISGKPRSRLVVQAVAV